MTNHLAGSYRNMYGSPIKNIVPGNSFGSGQHRIAVKIYKDSSITNGNKVYGQE